MLFEYFDKNSIIISIIIVLFICLILLYSDFFQNSKENILLLVLALTVGFVIISDIDKIKQELSSTVFGGLILGGSNKKTHKHSQNLDNNSDCTHHYLNKPDSIVGGAKPDLMKEALLDPAHNLKEVSEQLILLEDHLAHPRRRCRDCITKHYLTIEAFLREAITLDKEQKYFYEVQDLLNSIKPVMIVLLQKIQKGKPTDKEYLDTCQILRENRKKIMIKYALSN